MEAYKTLVREFFSEYVSSLRFDRGLTQEEMAEVLRISARAYGDLERGKYCFSSITLIFLFLMLEDGEIRVVLEGFREKVHVLEIQNVA